VSHGVFIKLTLALLQGLLVQVKALCIFYALPDVVALVYDEYGIFEFQTHGLYDVFVDQVGIGHQDQVCVLESLKLEVVGAEAVFCPSLHKVFEVLQVPEIGFLAEVIPILTRLDLGCLRLFNRW